MPGDGFGPGAQGDRPLEIGCLVFVIGNFPAEPVKLAYGRPMAS
jgi:hypothetical protein